MIKGKTYDRYVRITGTENQARKIARDKIAAIRFLGVESKAIDVSVSVWVSEWLENEIKPSRKESTYLNYKNLFDGHINDYFKKIKLSELTRMDIQKFINKKSVEKTFRGKNTPDKELSPRTVRLIHRILSASLTSAEKDEIIPRNPANLVTLPKNDKKPPKTIDQEVITKILLTDVSEDQLATVAKLALFTGMRRGETLALKWSDLNTTEETLSINKAFSRTESSWEISTTKNKSSIRVIPLPNHALEILKKHRANQLQQIKKNKAFYKNKNFIFATDIGDPIHPNSIHKGVKRLLQAAGETQTTTVHALRHSYASLLFAMGEDSKIIQTLLGHSSIKTTLDIYVHPEEQNKKSAIDKINNLTTNGGKNGGK